MNTIVVMGRLTKDPEVRYTQAQKVVCSFTLAVDRDFKNAEGKRDADFIPVVVWGKAAELCGNSLAKGHRLLVEGRLQIRNYEGTDGQRHWISEIVASNVQFIEHRADSAQSQQGAQYSIAQKQDSTPSAKGSYHPKQSGMSYTRNQIPVQRQYSPSSKSGYQHPAVTGTLDDEVPF